MDSKDDASRIGCKWPLFFRDADVRSKYHMISKRKWRWSHVQLCDNMDCSSPGLSVHGVSQARILEWVAISFSRGSSPPRDQTQVSLIAGRWLPLSHQGSPMMSKFYIKIVFIKWAVGMKGYKKEKSQRRIMRAGSRVDSSTWAAITEHYRLADLATKCLLTILEAGSLRSGCSMTALWKELFLVCKWPTSHYVLKWIPLDCVQGVGGRERGFWEREGLRE